MSKRKRYCLIGLFCVVLIFITVLIQRQYSKTLESNKSALGEQLVKALYDYDSVYELDAQMTIVKSICSEAVYNDLTIDNEQRTLTTYLKFKQDPVHGIIHNSAYGYVLYSLQTDSVSEDRLFCLYYRIGAEGKIDWVKEVECIEFLDTIY